ncbi:outer membrane protein assembly factor BamD [Legionella sp. D16C41]|uniref:outer membrane protein assembly factor BamD n=1 Tax=Legionella sp. D16C41 TaxID=3402688 RepID=UPI003AF7D732
MKRILALTLTLLVLLLTSCASWWGSEVDDNGPYKGMTAKQIFDQAQDAMAKKEYTAATKRLEALESMYPFSEFAEKAQLDLIYAYYQKEDYPSAAATAERYIHLYPRAKNVDYAYYMKGLANFQQNRGTFANVLPLDESWREPGTQTQAYADFSVLVQRFPESKYKNNALQRMVYLRNTFAQRELNTANYYLERKRYAAAIERANYLIKNYPQASSVQQALIVLYNANKALGLNVAAADALRVYQQTYHTLPAGVTA